MGKKGIFLGAIEECLANGETFSPEFLEAFPDARKFENKRAVAGVLYGDSFTVI